MHPSPTSSRFADFRAALPPAGARPWLAVAALVWVVVLAATAGSGPDLLPSGEIEVAGIIRTDVRRGRYGAWFLLETRGGMVLVEWDGGIAPTRGSGVRVVGRSRGVPGIVGGVPHRGTVSEATIEVVRGPSIVDRGGTAIRTRVDRRLQPYNRGRALVAGFLVGDVDHVDRVDREAMRKSGLSHYTAVSGSNVALFLGLIYVLAGPLALGPRRRAVVGLGGIPFYAAATGFEPSVMRASLMAALYLTGKLAGVVVDTWRLLSWAVIGLIVWDPGLAATAGFQLSVAATFGVLVGAGWPARTGVGRALAVTTGAQVAVAPLLVAHFGEVPIVSPLVNVIAAPIVTTSTLIGAIGVIGPGALIHISAWLAERVLDLAHAVSAWPTIGGPGLAAAVAIGMLTLVLPRARPVIVLAVAGVVTFSGLTHEVNLDNGDVAVLDVGQGDAVILWGGNGAIGLVDGGPDPVVLIDKLRDYGVGHLDMVVATHPHADHIGGLTALVGRIPIGRVWAAFEHHETEISDQLAESWRRFLIPVTAPEVGSLFRLGVLEVEVLAPGRRFAGSNDQSIVLMIRGPGKSMLLPGDIEGSGQAALGETRADILKVPHHGSATSDHEWLLGVGASLALISVGDNDFGHPAPEIVEVLEHDGVVVQRTDQMGDIVVGLGG